VDALIALDPDLLMQTLLHSLPASWQSAWPWLRGSACVLLFGLLPAAWLLLSAAALLAGAQARAMAQLHVQPRGVPRSRWLGSLLLAAGLWWPWMSAETPALPLLLSLLMAYAASRSLLQALQPRRALSTGFRVAMGVWALLLAAGQGLLLARLPMAPAAGVLSLLAVAGLLWLNGGSIAARGLRGVVMAAAVLLPLGVRLLLSGPEAGEGFGEARWQAVLAMWPRWALGARELALLLLVLLMTRALPALLRHVGEMQVAADKESDARFTDPLTGLATRLGLERQLAQAVLESDAKEQPLALLLFDLDGFNPVNSSFGHDKGDALLRLAADRLRGCLGVHDVAARIGGDEFAILLHEAGSKEAVASFAARVLAELARPYLLDRRELAISCSAGIARYPLDGGKARMLACADAAKSAAKRLGGACYCFYAAGMDGDTREQLDLLRDLRHAVERNQLELYFQPKIDARSGEVTAAEALLRWHHPTRGMVSPVIFIPIAERFGFMRELGNWVIDAACRQAQVWRESGLRMRVAINLSAQQMRQADIVDRIQKALEASRMHPTLLTCEITESVVMENTQAIQDTFRRLGELGVHLSIDDFGTGYSSLSYLRQLPAQELKVDRAFVTDLVASADARAVVDAVIRLAHALGLRVVAEGVETQGQQQVLVAMGCDELQGYLFARPMSAQAILLWAMDDKNSAPAFRASLFGDTQEIDQL